ncbi:Golgin sub A member 2 [Dinochytrium kinnereticum]|nr:Golgin sub A member 2 [Dinochytrium kinnereticum]
MEKVTTEGRAKDLAFTKFQERSRAIEEERSKNAKSLQALQAQVDKLRKSNEDLKKRNEALDAECGVLKKELDQRNKAQKQIETDVNSRELRLNRAVEEVEKYKNLLTKASAESKDKTDALKTNLEKLHADNKKLVKQKAEMITIFRKQNQLIDVLKRQKMHLESATLLKITEDEFVKALNSRAGDAHAVAGSA